MEYIRGARPLILIVEDHDIVVEHIEAPLRHMKVEILIAQGCTEALEILRSNAPNLIVLDSVLDDGLGYDLCATIRSGGTDRSLARLVDTPIVMLVEQGDKDERL